MLSTRFTALVGCAVPIQQAGMGAVAPPELAAAETSSDYPRGPAEPRGPEQDVPLLPHL